MIIRCKLDTPEASDTIYEAYKNISGLFKAAEPEVRWEIEQYLEDLKDPEG